MDWVKDMDIKLVTFTAYKAMNNQYAESVVR